MPDTTTTFWNRRLLRLANAFLLAGMMACVTYAVMLIVQRYSSADIGAYWLLIAVLAALESYRTHIKIAEAEPLSPAALKIYAVEWVVILVLLKLLTYLVGPSLNLWQEMVTWQTDFWASFFSGLYFGLVMLTLSVYLLTGAFAGHLLDLENDVDKLSLEKAGIPGDSRMRAYSGLTGMVFVVGGGMLALVTLLNIDFKSLPAVNLSVEPNALFLAAYFFLGFVMLALARYSLKEAHWFLLNIPSDSKIGKAWLFTSALIFGGISLVVALIPTRFSIGLFEWLNRIFTKVMTWILLIIGVITAPCLLLFGFLTSLLGFEEIPEEAQEIMPTLPAPETVTEVANRAAWVADAKAVAFWVIFGVITAAAFRAFILYNAFTISGVMPKGGFAWLVKGMIWIRQAFVRVNGQVVRLAQAGLGRIQRTIKQGRVLFEQPLEIISTNLPPRQRVLLMYMSLTRALDGLGMGRQRAETPAEYAGRIGQVIPAASEDLHAASGIFNEARYTRHPIDADQAAIVQQAATRIRAAAQAAVSDEGAAVRDEQ